MLQIADPDITVIDPDGPPIRVDITLIDTPNGSSPEITAALDAARNRHCGQVVLLVWDISVEVWMLALSKGCRGCIDKASTGQDMAAAIRSIDRGEIYISPTLGVDGDPDTHGATELSSRELDMITLIVEGYTNVEIAQSMYLSINTVKTYIRSAYKKIGIERRSDAVRWGIEQGFHLRSTLTPEPQPHQSDRKPEELHLADSAAG